MLARPFGPERRILAGRLGFEPRQSAPKALDLPLVDRPVTLRSILPPTTVTRLA